MPKRKIGPFDIVMNLIIFIVIPALSLWGGSKHWSGSADYLPFVLLLLIAVCITYFCIRFPLFRTGFTLGVAVPLCMILPSSLMYHDSDLDILLVVGIAYGLVVVSITKIVKRLKYGRAVEAESPSCGKEAKLQLREGEMQCMACDQIFVGAFDDQGRCPLCGELGK